MIHVVATQLKHGKGGISTALIGLCESDAIREHGLNYIESHAHEMTRWRAFRHAKQRIEAEVNANDIVWLHCGRWLSMLRKYFLAKAARRQGAKIVFQFHSAATANYLDSVLGRWFLKRIALNSDALAVLSPWWKEYFLRKLALIEKDVICIPNTLDERFRRLAQKKPGQSNTKNEIRLLTLTRLVRGKNVDVVIHALSKLPGNYVLSIAGDGPEIDQLKQLAKHLNIEHRVKFLGWVSYEDKIPLYCSHNIFVLPSSFDSFGMGFIEAMAAGLPVVALKQQATPDVVLDQRTGILVKNLSATEIANACESISSNLLVFSINAKAHVLKSFDNDEISRQVVDYFNKLKT